MLFMFSCSQVERVGDEPKSSNWISNVDEYIKTKKNIEVEADKLVVEQKEVETIYYKDIEPNTNSNEIRKVEFLKPNKFGVKYASANMRIENRGKIMKAEYKITISTFVSNGGNGYNDSECDWTEWYWEIPDDRLEKEKAAKLKELNGEFEKLISKIVKNSTNE